MSWFTEYKKSLKMVEVEEFFDLFFYRPLAFLLVKTVYRTSITPNQLTIIAIFIGLTCGFVYAFGPQYWGWGAICFALYNIVDCSDGQLARIKKNGTHAGRIVDGMADYISTAAAFIGIAIGGMSEHADNTSLWWFLLIITSVSNVVQSALVDYYRNRFLDYVLQRKSTFEEDYQSFVDEYNSIKDVKGKGLDRIIIRCYFKYSAMQRRIVGKKKKEKLFKAAPQDYYQKNKVAIRMWVTIGPTAQITAQMICSAFNRMDIFFWLMLAGFNGIALTMWIIQKNIDKSFKNSTHTSMKAVILAAGIASRLRPLTDNTPKCLLKVGDKRILELTIDNIIANDIDDVIIVTGYLEEQIKDFVSSKYPQLNVSYIYNEVYSSTNNIYSLWLAKDSLLGDEMLLMDSDIIFDKDIIGKLLSSGYDNCLALKRHNVQEEEIKVRVDDKGRVLDIGKEIIPKEAIGESIGIEKFGVEALYKLFTILDRKIKVDKQVNQFYEAAFQELVIKDADIFVVDTTDYICMEIDTAADLDAAGKLVLKHSS